MIPPRLHRKLVGKVGERGFVVWLTNEKPPNRLPFVPIDRGQFVESPEATRICLGVRLRPFGAVLTAGLYLCVPLLLGNLRPPLLSIIFSVAVLFLLWVGRRLARIETFCLVELLKKSLPAEEREGTADA